MAMFSLSSCAGGATKTQSDPESVAANRKAIVCFFSATGTTAAQAKRIAAMTGADLFEIVPQELYTAADLDWRNAKSRSSVEMNDRTSRPAIAGTVDNIADYDVVFIGYPNWWNTAPTIINTFIESLNLEGKTIVPFMTSGGSDIRDSEKDLKGAYPSLIFAEGLLMNGVSDSDIKSWLESLSL